MLRSFRQDPSWKHAAPAMPRWCLERDLGQARLLYKRVLSGWVGQPLTPQTREILAEELAPWVRRSPPASLLLAVQDSLTAESAQPLTPRVARKLALQLVCNSDPLLDGVPIPKFISVTRENTWAPLEITSIEDSQQERAKGLRKQINMLVIGGPFAGFEVAKICPCGYLSHLANDLGYSFRRPYEDQNDLVGLWLAGLLEPSSSLDVQFDKYWLNSAMSRRNAALVRERRWTEAEQLEGTQETHEEEEDKQ
jgi:hypothetical protein